jgi:hypothetical protein
MVAARAFACGGGQCPGRAHEVLRYGGDDQPRGIRVEGTRWQVSERPVVAVREDLLHDGVVAVLPFGLGRFERGAGEDGVVSPDGEQFVLALGCLLVEVADAADDEAGGDLLVLLRCERGVAGFGDFGVGDPAVQLVIEDRAGT